MMYVVSIECNEGKSLILRLAASLNVVALFLPGRGWGGGRWLLAVSAGFPGFNSCVYSSSVHGRRLRVTRRV